MTTTTDTTAALDVIAGKLGRSPELLRAQYGKDGMGDADLIETIQFKLGLGHIWVGNDREPLTDDDRAWLAAHMFGTDGNGRVLVSAEAGAVILPLPDHNGKIPGIIDWDRRTVVVGSDLDEDNQYVAVAKFRPGRHYATDRIGRRYRRASSGEPQR